MASDNGCPSLPKFDPGRIEEWFICLETIFSKHKVSKEFDKFAYTQAMLDSKRTILARDVIFKAHEMPDPFTQLKKLLLSNLGKGKMDRIREAISGETFINSCFCTVWLQKRKQKMENCSMDDIKKFLIVRALPESLQRNLDYSESLERLVEKADLYFKNSGELLD